MLLAQCSCAAPLKFSPGKIRANKCDNVVILTKGKIAKKIINAKLDKNPSIAPLTKAESSRTERRIEVNTHSFYLWLAISDWPSLDWPRENVARPFHANTDRVENLSKTTATATRTSQIFIFHGEKQLCTPRTCVFSFVHFFAVVCKTTTWNSHIWRFIEDVSTWR